MTEAEATELVSSLFESWYSSLVNYISWRAGSLETAEDVVQEGFMLLYRELRSGKKVENPKGWTLTVVRRQVSKELQSSLFRETIHVPPDVLDSLTADRPHPHQSEAEPDDVKRLFSVLSKREEEVIFLRLAAMKYREIADHLGISSSSVNTLLARALRKLQHAASTNPPGASGLKYADEATPKTLQ